MRFFDEEVGRGKTQKETCVIITHDEACTIIDAMTEYCKTNKLKKKAKALLKEMEEKWGCY